MADFPERIEAPNWLADDRLLYNAEGRLFTIEIATGRVAPVDTGSCVRWFPGMGARWGSAAPECRAILRCMCCPCPAASRDW